MSSPSPRVAIAIATTVVLPMTIFTVSRFDLLSIDNGKAKTSRLDRPFASIAGESLRHHTVERAGRLEDASAVSVRSTSGAKPNNSLSPVRRGPQILGTVYQRNMNSHVFAVSDDPFADVSESDEMRTSEAHAVHPPDLVMSAERSRRISSVGLEQVTFPSPLSKTHSADSVIFIPCQPTTAITNREEICFEINLFSGLSCRILQPMH